MNIKKIKSIPVSEYRLIILIFIIIATLMISNAIIEFQQSKKELYGLMSKQAHSLLESLIIASQNTLLATNFLDEISEQRLLNNAGLIQKMYENGQITNQILSDISQQNHLYRINIFNKNGHKVFSSHEQVDFDLTEGNNPKSILQPLLSGEKDTLMIGYKAARFKDGYRFAVALAAKDRAIIVLNIDAKEMLQFKRDIDFGALIRQITDQNPQIEYIALQDPDNILAASGNVTELDAIANSPFLMSAFQDSLFSTRQVTFGSYNVFEAVHPFVVDGHTVGLFRLGLSLQPLQDINAHIYRRLILITLILIGLGSVLFIYLFTRQRLNILQKQYHVVETYSSGIIDHVSDAILVFDVQNGIKIFNTAAENLFGKSKSEVTGYPLDQVFPDQGCLQSFHEKSVLNQIHCRIKNQDKELLVSKSSFSDHDAIENTILVIRDLTEQKQMEAQLQRQERLTAMGELASGVAHEIRNPLNTIGTIIQQLDKDFEPAREKEEYHQLARLVYGEVKRINETIQEFLRFARPEPTQASEFMITQLFLPLKQQYKSMLENQQIKLKIQLHYEGEVVWDPKQMKQVLMNLIQNAIDAIEQKGIISITVNSISDSELEIQIKDDGPGMTEEVRSNIFNLYYTTKAKGTGIGLSIVQRIVYEHHGIIHVESQTGQGTTFTIKLPIHF